jgi:hypothetical protein
VEAMTEFSLQLLSSAAVSTFLAGLLIWLTKSWISERLKNSIQSEETHKAQLKAQADIQSERLRAQLSITANEHQVRFSKLHDKRAEVIAELYSLLVQAYWDAQSFISPIGFEGEPSKREKYVTAMNASADYSRFFEKNKIYLPTTLCASLEEFVRAMRSKMIGFGVYVQIDEAELQSHTLKQKHKAWMDSWQYFDKEVPLAREALEQELRNILGPT